MKTAGAIPAVFVSLNWATMRWLLAILIVLFVALQYRLWFGEDSRAHLAELERAIVEQQQLNDQAKARNEKIAREVKALEQGMEALEERARNDLGMIRDGETFYMVIEKEPPPQPGEEKQP